MRRFPAQSRDAVLKDFGGAQFSTFKPALAELAVAKLAPIAEEMRRLLDAPDHIDAVLADGAARASAIAAPNMDEVKDVVGLLQDGAMSDWTARLAAP